MSDVQMAKRILRKKMRELIVRTLDQNSKVREEESALVREKLFREDHFLRAKRVSVYVSNGLEISTDEIIRNALSSGKEVFVPRFLKGSPRMEMLRLSSLKEFDALEETLWGIRQHSANLNPPSFHETPDKNPLDLVVLPGLAFTPCGKRLGHGRGFYDWFLNEYLQNYGTLPRTIGLALRVQLLEDLPMEEHDRRVDDVMHA